MTRPRTRRPNPYAYAAAAAETLRRSALQEAFDASFPDSRATASQLQILRDIGAVPHRYVIAGNQSGKSALAAREIVWILQKNHPMGWVRPAVWGDGPLLIIVAGQSRQMMEVEMWGKKLKPFLDPDEWREVRAGGALTMVEHKELGHQIVFISHADSSEKNRKLMQGYVANYVWLDEMPSSVTILQELQERVAAREGYFLATFTPKFRNDKIKKIIDSVPASIGKRYALSKLDNPLYAHRRQAEIDKLAGHTDAFRNAVLYGHWMVGDDMVYQWDEDLYGGEPPDSYSAQAWRHVAVVDPATESKLGLTLWAEDPETNLWWCILAEYIEKIHVPSEIVKAVERKLVGKRIVKRVADSHESWFIHQAKHDLGVSWIGIEGKTGNKDRYIRDFQGALGATIRVAHWCDHLRDEVQSCERNPETGKIKNKSRFHLVDTAHYFVNTMPKPEPRARSTTWQEQLRESHRLEQEREAALDAVRAQNGGRRGRVLDASVPIGPIPVVPPMPQLRVNTRNRGWR